MSMNLLDVIVVGGGPAGLSAALGLVRGHRSVFLIDSKQYRYSGAPTMQNVLTLDGVPPAVFREKARTDQSRYPTFSSIEGYATRVTQRDEAALQQHPLHKLQLDVQRTHTTTAQVAANGATEDSFLARRLLLAAGVKDILPTIPGFEAAWGDTIHVSGHTTFASALRDVPQRCALSLSNTPSRSGLAVFCVSLCALAF